MKAGQWASALLQCADTYGNPRPAITAIATGLQLELTNGLDGDDERAAPLPASQLRSEQRLNADGSIWLRYAPLGAGPRCLSVKLNKVHVLGSPLRLDVSPGTLHLPSCEIIGDGASICHLKERAAFRIVTKDAFGNLLARGGDKFAVSIEKAGGGGGGGGVTPVVRDEGDGTYIVEYALESVGTWGVSVKHVQPSRDGVADETILPGSPSALTCLPGSAHLPACKFVSAQHGTRVLTTADSADEDELHPTPGAAPYLGHVAACSSKLRVRVRLADKQGTHTMMSMPRQVQLAVLPERDPLETNPSEVVNPYGSDAKSFDSTLLAWVSSTVKSQRLAENNPDTALARPGGAGGSHLAAADGEGGGPAGGKKVPSIAAAAAPALAASAATGAFEGSSIVPLERAASDASDGAGGERSRGLDLLGGGATGGEVLYEAHIELRKARRYRLALVGPGGQSLGPPLAIMQVVPGRAHAASCVVGCEGLDRGFVGAPVDFWMRSYDAAGNALTKGGEKVSVHVKTPGHNDSLLTVKVRDEKDGAYALKFVPTASGMHAVSVKMGRETIGAAAQVMVYRSPAAASSALKLNINDINRTLNTGAHAPSSARGHSSSSDFDRPSARGGLSSARRAESPSARGTPTSARRESSPRRHPPVPSNDTSPRNSQSANARRAASPRSLGRPIPPDLVPAAAPSAEPPLAPRGGRSSTTPRATALDRDAGGARDEFAHAPVSARASMQSPAAAPSAWSAKDKDASVAFAPSAAEVSSSTDKGAPLKAGRASLSGASTTPNLPPRLPIHEAQHGHSPFTPAEAEPKPFTPAEAEPKEHYLHKRAESARGAGSASARRRESSGGGSGGGRMGSPRVDAPATARGHSREQRHATPPRASPRPPLPAAAAPSASTPARHGSPRGAPPAS